ncbi:PAS domain S-box protein [Rhodohalobacter sp. SW132]|uniref:PAS domain S-box protein n=1 Tax=Rhodohalobacter sp. SW132 TaxID=2293433 RepID=UPI000E24C9F2|nr:PAS domain S-box protein [Rhodohalobacter sp. SW132]REL29138.1 PAS domain S-box protein [Rhodohalobacter sp. SW132]
MSDKKYRALFRNSPEALFISTQEGRILEANDAACKMFGYSQEEILHLEEKELIDPESPWLNERIKERNETGSTRGELVAVRKNGEHFWCEFSSSLFQTDGGETLASIRIIDRSESKKAKTRVISQKDQLQKTFDTLSDAIFTLRVEGEDRYRFISVNRQFLQNMNLQKKDVIGAELEDVLPEEAIDFVKGKYREAIQKKENLRWEETLILSGRPVTGLVSVTPLFDKKGNATQLIGSISDISERKKAEEALRKVMDQSLDVICTIDEEGLFRKVSGAAKELWGYNPDEIIGKPFMDMVHPGDEKKTAKMAEEIRQGRSVTNFENRYIRKDGSVVDIIWSARWDKFDRLMYCVAKNATELKEAQKAAFRERERYEKMFMQLPAFACILRGVKHEYVVTNPNYLSLIGKVDVIGKTVLEVLPETAGQQVIELLDRAFQTGEVVREREVSMWIDKNDSGNLEEIILDFTFIPNKNRDGEVEGLFTFGVDVTDQVKAREAAEESNERYEYVTQATSDAIWDYVPATGELFWGEGFKKLFGYERENGEEGISRWMDKIHPNDLNKIEELAERMMTGKKDRWDQEYRFKKADGTYAFVRDKAIVVRDDEGRTVRVIGAIEDITYRKKEEQQLRLMEQIVTNVNEAVMVTRALPLEAPDGPEIVYVNEAFEKMTGYSANEVMGKTPRLLQGPNSDHEALEEMGEKLRRWESVELETINYKKNGDEFWVHLSVTPISNSSGAYTHWIAIEKDITLRKSRELQQELISDISHIFNEADNVRYSLQKTLSVIQDFGNFQLSEIWLTDETGSSIKLAASTDRRIYGREGNDEVEVLTYGTGLPGITWESDSLQIWKDLQNHSDIVRKELAKKKKITSGYGFPIKYRGDHIGVLVLGKSAFESGIQLFTSVLKAVALHLGEEIQRKQVEEELSRLFDSAPDIICIAGFDGYFKKVNPAMSELLGYTEEELLTKPILDFVHPEDREKTENEFSETPTEDEKHNFDNRYITKSGSIVNLSWASRLFTEEGIAYSVAKDITEKKELEELLAQASRMAKIGSWELDLRNEKIYWSNVIYEIFNVDREFEPTVESNLNFYKEGEDREKMWDVSQKAIETGESWDIEVKIKSASGNEKWVRSIGEAEFINGKCIRLYGSLQDIHEKKELEELLSKANRLAKIGSWEVDLIEEKLFWSDITRQIHEEEPGFTPDLEDGINYYKEGKPRETILKAVDEAINNGTSWDFELPIITAKGNEKWIRTIGEAEFADGNCVRIYGSFQDIHDRKSVEIRLKNTTDNLPGVVFQYLLYPDGNDSVKYLSEGSIDIWGISAEDAMEDFNRIWANCHHEDIQGVQKSILKSANSLDDWHYSWRYYHPNGTLRWQEGYGTPQKFADGTVVWDSIIFDITEKKELENLLEQTTRLARVGSWELDLQKSDNKMYWSEMTREILEVDEEYNPTLTGGFEFYTPESKEKIQDAVENALSSGEPFDEELLLITSHGKKRWVRCIGQAEIVDGEAKRIYGSFQDIHDRKSAEEKLKKKSRQIDAISKLNSALLNYQNWFSALEQNLEIIGEAIQADRVYYFQNYTNPETGEQFTSQKLEWTRGDIDSQFENPEMQNIPFSEVPELLGPMIDGNPSTALRSKVPDDSMVRHVMDEQNIKAFLCFPVVVNGDFYGFVGFDNCTVERFWTDEEVEALTTITASLSTAIERDISDRELQEAYAERNRILESISDAFYAVDKNWIITYFNSEAEKVLKRSSDEIIGKSLWEVFAPAAETKLFDLYHKTLDSNKARSFEYYYPPLEDWFDISAYPSEDGIAVYFKKITQRKEEQARLVEKTRQLDAISIFNGQLLKQDNWLTALDECLSMLGEVARADRVYYFENNYEDENTGPQTSMKIEWSREGITPQINRAELQNTPFHEIQSFIDVLSSGQPYNRIVSEVEDETIRELLRSQDIKSILALPVMVGNRFRGFIGFDNCTMQHQWTEDEFAFLRTVSINLASAIENDDAEIALQNAYYEKKEILESIGDGFFAVDKNFKVSYWNSKAEELLKTQKDEILGEYLWDVFNDATELESHRAYNHALKNQEVVQFEDYYEPIDSWFEVSAYPSEVGLSVFFRDITERKRANERLKNLNRKLKKQARELEASNEELEQFAFVASHDLQEPLRMITGFLALLEKKYDSVLDEKGRQYIYFATDGAKRMRQIILDLLEFSRVGRADTEKEPVDVKKLIEDVLTLNKKLIEESGAEVHVEPLPQIHAVKSSVRQLFLNLINNAIKYRKNGVPPQILIKSEETELTWKFKITDNGIGINPAYADKIFNIFQRLHGTNEYSGTGMGLAICKKIVEEHGGKIWVESEEGEGSTFIFSIAKHQMAYNN